MSKPITIRLTEDQRSTIERCLDYCFNAAGNRIGAAGITGMDELSHRIARDKIDDARKALAFSKSTVKT